MGDADDPARIVIRDMDEEILLEHFALEAEAASLRSWVQERGGRPDGLDARLRQAEARRLEGNATLAGNAGEAAWLYLAALHALDYSLTDRATDGLDAAANERQLHEAAALVLANLAAAFGAKDDHHNAERAATLGLDFVGKLITPAEAWAGLRAKLLYRRGCARSKGCTASATGAAMDYGAALADVSAAVDLDAASTAPSNVMRRSLAALRKLAKEASRKEPRGFLLAKGKTAAANKQPPGGTTAARAGAPPPRAAEAGETIDLDAAALEDHHNAGDVAAASAAVGGSAPSTLRAKLSALLRQRALFVPAVIAALSSAFFWAYKHVRGTGTSALLPALVFSLVVRRCVELYERRPREADLLATVAGRIAAAQRTEAAKKRA
ncbi:hypothetical protein M885DRAFT_531895 [Pelagophyceae sp. CCMP2097]|nr:hypothetical protein M885DRAFT_531895 [Pelagophyceae sp. CCMP2097]